MHAKAIYKKTLREKDESRIAYNDICLPPGLLSGAKLIKSPFVVVNYKVTDWRRLLLLTIFLHMPQSPPLSSLDPYLLSPYC